MLQYLVAYWLVFMAHEAGHDLQAHREGAHLSWSWSANRPGEAIPGPLWRYDTDRHRTSQRAMMVGAGFRAQDTLSGLTSGTKWENAVRLASAYQKLGSVLWFPGKNTGEYVYGDVRSLEYYTGSKAAEYFLAASACADIYKAFRPEAAWDLEFWQADDGTPGVKFTTSF
jgi:hypothetical protein